MTYYSIPKEFENLINPQSLKTIAFYSKNFGILISKNDFNQLNTNNQIALIIHESLRHVQIQYNFRMSDVSIQKITAAIVNREPHTGESLDTKEYVDGALLERIELPKMRMEKISELTDRACKIALSFKSEMIEMDQEEVNQVCFGLNKLNPFELSIKVRNLAGALDFNREAFLTVLNIANDLYRSANTDIAERANPSFRELTDAELDARHAIGVDAAIDQANRGIGWLTGTKRQIQNALQQLIRDGFLKK